VIGGVASDGFGGASAEAASHPASRARELLFPLSDIDLSGEHSDRGMIESLNPHRHEMALLDRVVWLSPDRTLAVGLHRADPKGFWVRGHFPGRPLLPGVLMVEAAAQLCCYQWNSGKPEPKMAVFTRIDETVFRRSVVPGDELFILCQELKNGRRRFVSRVQGVLRPGTAEQEIAFEAKLAGVALD